MGIRFVWGDELERIEFERVVEQLMERSLGAELTGNLLRHAHDRKPVTRRPAGPLEPRHVLEQDPVPGPHAVARRPAAVHLQHVAAGDARIAR